MNRNVPKFVFECIIVCVSILNMVYAQNNDSISYYRIRNNYNDIFGDNKFYREYIEVSDGLASAKLFREAEDILTDLFEEEKHSFLLDTTTFLNNEGVDNHSAESLASIHNPEPIQTVIQPYDTISWRVNSSGSYNKYHEKIDSANTISNGYFSGNLSLESHWIPKSNYIDKFSAYFKLTDYDGELGSKIELSFLNNHVGLDGEFQGKLPINKQYRDSSSKIITKINSEFTSSPLNNNSTPRPINLQLDLNFTSTQNRKDRYFDISNRLYTIEPLVEWTSKDLSKSSSIGFSYNYRDYNRYVSISNDIFSTDTSVREDDHYNLGPFIEADFINEFIYTFFYWSVLWEHYLKRNDTIPSYDATSNRKSSTKVQAKIAPTDNFEFYLSFNYDMLQEHYPYYELSIFDIDETDTNSIGYDIDTIAYTSKTHIFSIEPELFFYYRLGIGNSIKFLYERQTMKILSEPRYISSLSSEKIEDDYFSYLIGISFFTNFTKFSFETIFNFTKIHIINKTEFSDSDSYEFEPSLSFTLSPLKWLSFRLDGKFGYRRYLENSNPEFSTGISLGCNLNF